MHANPSFTQSRPAAPLFVPTVWNPSWPPLCDTLSAREAFLDCRGNINSDTQRLPQFDSGPPAGACWAPFPHMKPSHHASTLPAAGAGAGWSHTAQAALASPHSTCTGSTHLHSEMGGISHKSCRFLKKLTTNPAISDNFQGSPIPRHQQIAPFAWVSIPSHNTDSCQSSPLVVMLSLT